MNREPNADQIVTRWVDDGPEIAPERFVWAALDEVERTPQRGSWRVALENTPMLLKVAVPVLGAAAVILLGIFALGRLNPAPTGTPVESPAAVASPTATPNPCARDLVHEASPGVLDVMWCTPRGSDTVVLPFTMDGPSPLADMSYTGGEVLYLRFEGQPTLFFALSGPDTVDEWVAAISDNAAFDVSEPTTVEIAGGEAAVIDVTLGDGVNPGDAPPLIESSDVPLTMQEGDTARVWILAGQGEAVAVAASTTDDAFDAWAGQVGQALQSLEWGTP